MTKKEFNVNKKYLVEGCTNIFWNGQASDEDPFSVELESYTHGGEDMIINLETCDKEHLQEYIDNFDINEKVVMWWPDGQAGRTLPFSNIKEHYEDYEDWLNWLQSVCDNMPY